MLNQANWIETRSQVVYPKSAPGSLRISLLRWQDIPAQPFPRGDPTACLRLGRMEQQPGWEHASVL